MPESLWVAIPEISDRYRFIIKIDHENPISLGNLGLLFWALDESLRASSGRYIAARSEFRTPLAASDFQPFDGGLRLSFEGVERGSWKVWANVGGSIAAGIIAGLLANNVDRILQTWGVDSARYVQNPNATPNPPPFERACEKALEAAQKLNATGVICTVTGPNGIIQRVELLGPNTPRRR